MRAAQAGETSADYNYDDDETPQQPGNLEKTSAAPLRPFFKEGQVVVYANRSEERVKLDCPVQNYDGNHQVIMWYQDESVLSNGNKSMGKDTTIDDQFTLTIPIENATQYHYSCRVIPHNVRRNVTVQFPATSGAPTISWTAVVGCIIVAAIALLHPVAPRY
ncbi:hypothetical protein KR093_003654 [Drosophila rubida]|uniref:Ig-like domain-containing protein n=1 Tax=Drosophila rubida TaxID=30044 RepID=A0AAD4PJB8_9MUSC|nr:hypothetical protein KR093_003654 [Drosophila rubida]